MKSSYIDFAHGMSVIVSRAPMLEMVLNPFTEEFFFE